MRGKREGQWVVSLSEVQGDHHERQDAICREIDRRRRSRRTSGDGGRRRSRPAQWWRTVGQQSGRSPIRTARQLRIRATAGQLRLRLPAAAGSSSRRRVADQLPQRNADRSRSSDRPSRQHRHAADERPRTARYSSLATSRRVRGLPARGLPRPPASCRRSRRQVGGGPNRLRP